MLIIILIVVGFFVYQLGKYIERKEQQVRKRKIKMDEKNLHGKVVMFESINDNTKELVIGIRNNDSKKFTDENQFVDVKGTSLELPEDDELPSISCFKETISGDVKEVKRVDALQRFVKEFNSILDKIYGEDKDSIGVNNIQKSSIKKRTIITFIINGEEYNSIKDKIYYEDVVRLVFNNDREDYTVTFKYTRNTGGFKVREGVLIAGDYIDLVDGLVINIADTNNS